MSPKSLGRESETGIKTIFCDGGAHNTGNRKGLGAWAFVEPSIGIARVHTMLTNGVTNNITEMQAIINGIQSFEPGTYIDVISDSGYVVKGYNHPAYLDMWIKSNWKTSTNTDVANRELWEQIIKLSYRYGLKLKLMSGHYKDSREIWAFWNAVVDQACTYMMNKYSGLPQEEIIMEFDFASKTFKCAYSTNYDRYYESLNIRLRGKQK